ncbi:MAG TPA: response regulator [Candidatus Sulfotelmatobacter sp.]
MKSTTHVLLVDDNPADLTLTMEALAACQRHSNVNTVMDGEQAMAFLFRRGPYANQVRPNLVILDLNLPKKDGRAVLKEVKSDPDLCQIPVVIFSSSQANDDIVRSYQLGANCYVSKPGNLKSYFAALQSIEEFWFGLARLPQEGV